MLVACPMLMLVLLAEPVPTTPPEAVGISSQRLVRLKAMMQSEVDRGHIGSAIGLVARQGKIVFLEAVGEHAPGVAITPSAIVRLASSAKSFTAAATMVLYEEGKLRLDDPVADYIPAWVDAKVTVTDPGLGAATLVEPSRPVTIRDLLTHESGIDVASDAFEQAWRATESSTTTLDLAERMARIPMVAHPGTRWDYGYYGSNYEILAAVLEQASGMTLEALFQEKLFKPLGMEDSYFFVPDGKAQRLSAIYQMRDGQLSIKRPAGEESERSTFLSGGGGVRSTIADFHRFCQMLLNGGVVDDVRILSPKSVQMMMTDHAGPELQPFGDAEYGWGFGATVRRQVKDGDIGSAGTYAWNGGTGTAFWIDPKEDLIGIVFAPYWPPAHNELRKKFEVGMYQAVVSIR